MSNPTQNDHVAAFIAVIGARFALMATKLRVCTYDDAPLSGTDYLLVSVSETTTELRHDSRNPKRRYYLSIRSVGSAHNARQLLDVADAVLIDASVPIGTTSTSNLRFESAQDVEQEQDQPKLWSGHRIYVYTTVYDWSAHA